jgi:hypothetical protein
VSICRPPTSQLSSSNGRVVCDVEITTRYRRSVCGMRVTRDHRCQDDCRLLSCTYRL